MLGAVLGEAWDIIPASDEGLRFSRALLEEEWVPKPRQVVAALFPMLFRLAGKRTPLTLCLGNKIEIMKSRKYFHCQGQVTSHIKTFH